jgi:AcrR family transcriptional regulator
VARATLYRQVKNREDLLGALSEGGVDLGERVDIQGRILSAARVVFSRAGFDAATLEDIAREADVGPATVYRQFKDKAGLIRAFGDRFGPRRAVMEIAVSASGDVRADLERIASTVLRAAATDSDLLRLALLERLRGGPWAEVLGSSPMSSQKTVARLMKSYQEKGALRGEDPRLLAQTFSGMLLSFVTSPFLDGKPRPDPEETARFLASAFLDGLATARSRR